MNGNYHGAVQPEKIRNTSLTNLRQSTCFRLLV